jgi:hypothetical protein
LSGNLRLLKGEMRQVNCQMSWERWKGLLNVAGTGPITFFFNNATQFSVNDNFSNTGRNIAVPGRRVRAFHTSGLVMVGSIVSVVFTAPSSTAINCSWDAGVPLNATLTEVQFGPEPMSLVTEVAAVMINRTNFTMNPGNIVCPSSANDTSVVLPDQRATLRPVLVCTSQAINGAFVAVLSSGLCTVAVDAAVTRGRYLISGGAGSAGAADSGENMGSGFPPYGTFGVAVSSIGGAGIISAVVFGTTVTPPLIQPTSNGFGRRFVSAGAADTAQMVPGDVWMQY